MSRHICAVRANLTGKEYAKLMIFFRRWNDVPAPTPAMPPSPKTLIFSQPMTELKPKDEKDKENVDTDQAKADDKTKKEPTPPT